MRDDRERLKDILEAIAQVEKYAVRGQNIFQEDELIQIWIVHHLQISGEASSALTPRITATYLDVLWAEIVAFRNILVHEYFRVNLEIVWRTVERDLPNLKAGIEAILQEIGNV